MSVAKVTGEGTIVQLEKDKPKSKCRKWQLRVSTGLDPRTGKYKIRTRRIKGIYTEMAKALRTFIDELEHDAVQGRSKYTFEEYAERYLEQRRAKKEIADTALARQRCQLKAICRHIGKANLSAVTTVMLNDMYIAMLNGDTSSGVPSVGSYVNQIHNNVKLVFDRAVEEGILTVNPALKATPPKMDTAEKRALTQAKADELLSDLDPTSDRDCAYLIALTLGLRRGEVCGLSWGDIDFDERLAYINHSFDMLGNLKATKTKAGTRILPLPDVAHLALSIHKQAQAERYARTNKYRHPWDGYIGQGPETPIVSGKSGERIKPTSLSRWWNEDRKRFGLDGWTFHELRHTYLTLLARKGVHPKVMQSLAGHASSKITMDIYTHVNMDAKRDAVERLFHFVDGGKSGREKSEDDLCQICTS